MDDTACRRFFLEPQDTLHRRYEILRAFFVDHRPWKDIAEHFGCTYETVHSLVRDFRRQIRAGAVPPFSPHPG
jgi:hypothetical protein